jgi:cell division protein FtsB
MASAGHESIDSRLNPQRGCDSVIGMRRKRQTLRLPRESLTQTMALIVLLVLGALALAGPSGVLAWTENARALDHNQREIARLTALRDRLHNRVDLLDPRHADPDLVGELLRRDLNVAHPDEVILPRK